MLGKYTSSKQQQTQQIKTKHMKIELSANSVAWSNCSVRSHLLYLMCN